jgi:hypothetical protein
VWTDVLEERITSISMVEKAASGSQKTAFFIDFVNEMLGYHSTCRFILSHIRGLCDEYNRFWIGWLDLLPPLQLQLIITAHNQWLLKTHSIPYWTASAFSSYCDRLGSDLRISHFFSFCCMLVNTPHLNTKLLTNSLKTESLNSLTNAKWLNFPELN